MSGDAVLDSLLSSVETGEELHDPREGDHDGVLKEVGVVKHSDKGNYYFNVSFDGMESAEGDPFSFSTMVLFAGRDSDVKIARMFLASLHDFGIVPRTYKQAIYASNEEQREAIVRAFQSKVGTTYPVRIYPDKNGDLRLRVRRTY